MDQEPGALGGAELSCSHGVESRRFRGDARNLKILDGIKRWPEVYTEPRFPLRARHANRPGEFVASPDAARHDASMSRTIVATIISFADNGFRG